MYPLCGALSFPALASNWSCYLHPRSTPPSPGEKRASRPPPARPLCSWGGWSPPSSKPGCSYPPPLRKQFTCALARAKAVLIAACRKFNGLFMANPFRRRSPLIHRDTQEYRGHWSHGLPWCGPPYRPSLQIERGPRCLEAQPLLR